MYSHFQLDNSSRQQQTFWKGLFDLMLEVETGMPTRFNRENYTASSIDRVFISLPSHATQEPTIKAKVAHDSTLLSDDQVSDRAVITLTLGIKPKTPLVEQAIHPSIFRDPNYAVYLQQLLDAAKTNHTAIDGRWRTHERLMVEAASQVRDDWFRKAFSNGPVNKMNFPTGKLYTARSISRAV